MKPIHECKILRECICRALNVSKEEFHSRSKQKDHTDARALFFWYGYKKLSITIDVLTDFQDRTTTSFYMRTAYVRDRLETEPERWGNLVNKVESNYRNMSFLKKLIIAMK